MITRQKILYYTIYKQRELLKLVLLQTLFLLKHEAAVKLNAFYDFLPYNSKPFSFQINDDLINFSSLKLINSDETLKINMDKVNNKYFPTCDIQIVIDKMLYKLANNQANQNIYDEHFENISQKKFAISPMIYSLGYEGLSVDAYFNILLQNNINILIDVRNNPYSRKFGFSSNTLNNICSKLNIKYYHFPQLGIPSSLRKNLNNKDSYLELFKVYTTTVIPREQENIKIVKNIIKDNISVFMCFEKDYQMCHRSYLLNSMDTSIPIKHL